MTIDALRSFKQCFGECEIAVLADISARTVLAWASTLKWPQEELDRLCEMAAGLLEPEVRQALLIRETGCHLFRRTAADGAEVLCCVLAADAPLEPILHAADKLCLQLRGTDVGIRA